MSMSIRLSGLSATALLMSACAISATPPSTSTCNADAATPYVGQVATSPVVEAARRKAGAGLVRTLKPGQMVTMEYLDGRLNLHLDADNKIIRATCG